MDNLLYEFIVRLIYRAVGNNGAANQRSPAKNIYYIIHVYVRLQIAINALEVRQII